MKLLNILSSNKSIKALIAFSLLAVFSLSSCGKRQPPQPPLERVSQKVLISGFQRGKEVVLSWTMPARNASGGSILNIARVDIYRLAESSAETTALSEAEFSSRSTLIASLPVNDVDFGLKKMSFADKLEFANQPVTLRYAVRFVNESGQKAGFSNFLAISPAPRVAEAPEALTAAAAETEISLRWNSPLTNVDGSQPPNLLGFNLYRSPNKNATAVLLNDKIIGGNEFADQKFSFGQTYFYFVRAVSPGSDGAAVESRESNIVEITPKDIFPPNPPAAITTAASPGTISIFFAVNLEKDIAGYRIYRSEDPNLDRAQWKNLTPELLTTNTFQDKSVESGKTYYYAITAVDLSGNVSNFSTVVSEKAF